VRGDLGFLIISREFAANQPSLPSGAVFLCVWPVVPHQPRYSQPVPPPKRAYHVSCHSGRVYNGATASIKAMPVAPSIHQLTKSRGLYQINQSCCTSQRNTRNYPVKSAPTYTGWDSPCGPNPSRRRTRATAGRSSRSRSIKASLG